MVLARLTGTRSRRRTAKKTLHPWPGGFGAQDRPDEQRRLPRWAY